MDWKWSYIESTVRIFWYMNLLNRSRNKYSTLKETTVSVIATAENINHTRHWKNNDENDDLLFFWILSLTLLYIHYQYCYSLFQWHCDFWKQMETFQKTLCPNFSCSCFPKTLTCPNFLGNCAAPPLPQLLRPVRLCLWCNYTVFNFFTERIRCTVARLSTSDVLCFRRRSQRGNPENI